MKKLSFLCLLLVAISKCTFAQSEEDYPDMRSWAMYGDSIERYVYADTAYIRVSPDTRQAPVDTLFAGDNLVVLRTTKSAITVRGLRGPWLQVTYKKNGEQKNGYIWQGLVSLSPLRRGDTKFIAAVERRADSTYLNEEKRRDTIRRLLVKVKAVQNGVIKSTATFITPDDESANFGYGKIMSGMGLTNVQNIVTMSFSGEACGIPTYTYYLAWTTDQKLVKLPGKMTVGDAGVFYHDENFIFPNEKNGRPDLITWEMSTEEATDKVDKNGEYVMEITEKGSKTYIWDPGNYTVTEMRK
ncbi:hypothetical protein SAMN05444266_102157 [Chitinophaga jiangningensis]|uniref:SH3 domain-containing protein n=1 Tax=Chitinophaga jiangningensis TaxID=1419482 RepID=A0A1M6Y5G0_9BACT|nr:hypothetical protein [Chitinophaga jiangningensis]SHL13408.1 hypothetical protein SAMN05444266_102157 [Chitinophaga jiangningensis]